MKGQFNKPICAIMTSLVLVLGTFALVFPPQDVMAHNNACGKIEILKNDEVVVTYEKCRGCTGNNCSMGIDISKRHEALFKRACGDSFTDHLIPMQTLQIIVDCDILHGPWDVRTTGTIDGTHGSNVLIRIAIS